MHRLVASLSVLLVLAGLLVPAGSARCGIVAAVPEATTHLTPDLPAPLFAGRPLAAPGAVLYCGLACGGSLEKVDTGDGASCILHAEAHTRHPLAAEVRPHPLAGAFPAPPLYYLYCVLRT